MTLQNYGTDTFQNTKTAGWNPASDGQAWAQAAGGSTPSIITAAGQQRGQLTGDNTANIFSLGSRLFTDVDLYVRVNASAAEVKQGVNGRATASTTYYRADIGNGTAEIVVNNSGSRTTLATTSFTTVAGTYYWVHLRIRGFGRSGSNPNNLKANFWADPSSGSSTSPSGEPAGWMLTASDGSITAPGQFGVYYNAVHNGESGTFDTFTCTDLPAPDVAPAYNITEDRPYGVTQFVNTTAQPPLSGQLVTDLADWGNGANARWQWEWIDGEPYQGFYDWGRLDDAVAACNYAGVRLWFAIASPPTFRQTLDGMGSDSTLNGSCTPSNTYTSIPISALRQGAYLPHGYQIVINSGGGSAETVYIWNPGHTYTAGATSIGISTSATSQVGWTPANTHSAGEPVCATTGFQYASEAAYATYTAAVAARFNGLNGFGKIDVFQAENENYDILNRVQGQGSYNTVGGSPASWDQSSTWDNGGAILAPVYIAVYNAIRATPGHANTPIFACAVRKTPNTARQHIINWVTGFVIMVLALGGTVNGIDFHYYRNGTVNYNGVLIQDPTISTYTDSSQTVINAPAVAVELADLRAILAGHGVAALIACGECGWDIIDNGDGARTTTTTTYTASSGPYTALATSNSWAEAVAIPDGTPIAIDYQNPSSTEFVYAYGTTNPSATSIPITTNALGSGAPQVAWTPTHTHASGITVYGQVLALVSLAQQAQYTEAMYDALRTGGAAYCLVYTDDPYDNTVNSTVNPPKVLEPKSITMVVSSVYTYEPTYIMTTSYSAAHPTWIAQPSVGGTYYPSVILADSPLVYYRLDEQSGPVAKDSSGHSNAGTYAGSGITYSEGGAIREDSDTSVLLDGSTGDIACPSGVAPPGSGFSVEAWVNLSNNTFTNLPTICSSANPSSTQNGFSFWLGQQAGQVNATIGNGSSHGGPIVPYLLVPGNWYHLCLTYNGVTGVAEIYVNGRSIGSQVQSGPMAAASNAPIFGHQPGSSGDYFPGLLDEVAIYPTVLSADRVMAHYTAGARGQPPSALSGFLMDLHAQKIQVVKVYDASGNYLGIWNDAPRMTGYKQTVNCADGQVKLVLPRKIDQWSSDPTIALQNQVKIVLFGPNLPVSGLLKFNGFIDAIEPNGDANHSESVTVTLTPWSAAIGDHGYGGNLQFTTVDAISGFWSYWFNTIDPLTSVPYTYPLVQDPANPTSFGTTVSYLVQNLDMKSIDDTAIAMLGASAYFWRPNSSNTVTLAQYATAAQHTFLLGKHIRSLSYSQDNTQRKNVVVFVGGTPSGHTTPIMATAVGASARPASEGGIGERLLMQQDSRITDQATADLVANNLLALYDRPIIRGKLTLVDVRGSNNGLGYDIETVKTGEMVTIINESGASQPTSVWGNFVWGQSRYGSAGGPIFNSLQPIVAVTYNWDSLDVEIGMLAPSQDRQLAALRRTLQDYTVGQ